jgi:hypothetical protein
MTLDEKAKLYDQLLLEHDRLAREVSLIQGKFDLTVDDNKKVDKIKKEMFEIETRANNLGAL